MILPTLHTGSGAGTRIWTIRTDIHIIETKTGLLGGAVRTTNDIILGGEREAEREAKARWNTKVRKGWILHEPQGSGE